MAILLPALLVAPLPAAAGEIHEAVIAGDQARVAALLAGDPSLASQPLDNPTRDLPLHVAATHGRVEIARLLLEAGAEVDGYDADESTPLDVAAVRRQPEMVAFLIQRGASVSHLDLNGGSPMSFAAFGGDSTIVRMLLDAGADLDFRDAQGRRLMHAAGARGHLGLMDLLVQRGYAVDERTLAGETPLYWAARAGQTAAVERLIGLGANPAMPDTFGRSPLHMAVMVDGGEVVRLLLAHGADPNGTDRDGEAPLVAAAIMGRAGMIGPLLAAGAEVNHAAPSGRTALSWAVQNGNTAIAAALLEAGARAEVGEVESGRTPLHTAAQHGHKDLAELLLDHGASPSTPDAGGNTPADLAARYGHRGLVELFTERGATTTAIPADGALAAPGTLAAREMKVWSLGHSGWAIQTANHFLIFDYAVMGRPADEPGLRNGHIAPEEIAGQDVTVFVSHEHRDHFDPTVFSWSGKVPRMTYLFGFAPELTRRGDLPEVLPAHEVMGPRETRGIGGMKVTTIESNDTGVGFLVEADGVVIFHAGDHANRNRDFSGPFKSEIEFLASTGVRPDVAFLPVSGCGFGDQEAVRLGDDFVLEALKPALFLPMHGGDLGRGYREFIQACGTRFPATQMRALQNRGDCLSYRSGKVS